MTGTASRPSPTGDTLARPVLVVDTHELVGTALAMELQSAGERAAFYPPRSLETVRRLTRHGEGIVVLELDLGHDEFGNRIDVATLIPDLTAAGWRVIVLTGSSDAVRIGAALDAGGYLWVSKREPLKALLEAVQQARNGRSPLSSARREDLVRHFLTHRNRALQDDARLATLTPREHQVLAMLAAGHRARTIADTLVVSLATVRTQIGSIRTKLQVTSQLEAVAVYSRARKRSREWSGT
ncbi:MULTISPECIES: LuxR C-terminal-related transcriptional regulator [unclassified Pseudonocardia]|uniref:LuxR C-terminal-related transcriptional regulator n=1 Tax=unclassified Pseudonocardia TaxID=2619320 RepID=UPI00076141D6|nr:MULTISPECIES: response regulator transcription factor [unclassified Pseudonocardia]